MVSIQERIQSVGVVPVISIDDPQHALQLGKALLDGGLPIAEITFRTQAGQEAIRLMRDAYPEILVGAGTIISVEDAKRAQKAGAQFIVSPGYDDQIVEFCQDQGLEVFPGVNNPTQIQAALKRGLSVLKFFPAEASGSLGMLKSLHAPFPAVKFMPTGGINLDNLGQYLKLPYIVACGGSWMVPSALMKEGRWEEISALCKQAVYAVHGFSFAHLGINEKDEKQAQATTRMLSHVLQPMWEKPNSYFSSEYIEIMKSPNLGTHGHIGIHTYDVPRALKYLSLFGFEPTPGSERRSEQGKLYFVYLSPEVSGFALHLMNLS
mgnify:CR=1 FL=1